MEFRTDYAHRANASSDLFGAVFTASEGAQEGAAIAKLSADLLAQTPHDDLLVCLAVDGDVLAGAVIFTPLRYHEDPRKVALLSPMAIATAQQGKGIGQDLIRYGLNQLRARDTVAVLTYGDINFYAKTAFTRLTQEQAQAPFALSYPEGWLGLSLAGGAFAPLQGPATCATALSDPAFW